jgi:hypothetical protein
MLAHPSKSELRVWELAFRGVAEVCERALEHLLGLVRLVRFELVMLDEVVDQLRLSRPPRRTLCDRRWRVHAPTE